MMLIKKKKLHQAKNSLCQEEQGLVELLTQEKSTLLEANEESRVRIRELEEDIKTLTQRTVDRETEMER